MNALYVYKNSYDVYGGLTRLEKDDFKKNALIIGDYVQVSNTENGFIKGSIKDIIPKLPKTPMNKIKITV